MNKVIAILSLLSLLSGRLLAQDTEEKLDQIRSWFNEVNTDIDQFKKVELRDIQVYKDINPEKYSVEGNNIYRLAAVNMIKFFDKDKLVKLVVTFDGDREDLVSAYYFREDDLFFIDKSKTIYHRPKWHDNFETSQKSIARNRFYVKNGSLLKWVDSKLLSIGKTHPDFSEQESIIIHDANVYRAIN